MPRRKIPTKAELIRLQKLYKTDEKIAERLGNVTPHLVAYWRRKKNIPRHAFPKFSLEEVRDLWERFGDDYRCGLELGISKAAFYNWRRKYEIKSKPAFLKLEQLELNLDLAAKSTVRKSGNEERAIAGKVIARAAGVEKLEVGAEVDVEPDMSILHNDAAQVIEEFQKGDRNYIWNANRVMISLNNPLSTGDVNTAEASQLIREFARMQNIKYFYDLQGGAAQQLAVEHGHVLPGQLVFSTTCCSSAIGCIGCMGLQINVGQMADLWINEKIKVTVPPSIKIAVNGRLPGGTFAMDLALFIARMMDPEQIKGKAIEFHGSAISRMSIPERFTLAAAFAEMGALTAVCTFDSVTRRYLLRRARLPYRPALPDKNAIYEQNYEFNVEHLTPQIAAPHDINNVESAADIAGLAIDQVLIGGCSGGRFEDLRIAADILKGKKVHDNVRLFILPGSMGVYIDAIKKGLTRAFLETGAIVLNPGCITCSQVGATMLASGEKCLATVFDNGRGKMGSPEAEIYAATPATAAASAINGLITEPIGYIK
jgi:3-isopropylmalate/(R)-2-methylmalate dehydratase large subunit